MKRQSPCVACRRVAEPEKCDNKLCKPWQQWFLASWEELRAAAGVTGQAAAGDPCESCVCPRELCIAPCREKVRWEEGVREEV